MHGIGAVAVALAEEVADVWLEVVSALEPQRRDDVGSGSGAIDLP